MRMRSSWGIGVGTPSRYPGRHSTCTSRSSRSTTPRSKWRTSTGSTACHDGRTRRLPGSRVPSCSSATPSRCQVALDDRQAGADDVAARPAPPSIASSGSSGNAPISVGRHPRRVSDDQRKGLAGPDDLVHAALPDLDPCRQPRGERVVGDVRAATGLASTHTSWRGERPRQPAGRSDLPLRTARGRVRAGRSRQQLLGPQRLSEGPLARLQDALVEGDPQTAEVDGLHARVRR